MRLPVKSLKRDTEGLPEIIVDTSTFFSSIYNPDGNESKLFELAEEGLCKIVLFQYVLDELQAVFQKKGIDFKVVLDLLDTYENIYIEDMEEPEDSEIEMARKLISDPKDRPIFIFTLRRIENGNTYFVSGDKIFFKEDVRKILRGRVLRTSEALKLCLLR